MRTRHGLIIVLCTAGLLLDACGSSEQTAGIDRGGVRSPVATSGTITAFGSIWVNGIRFDIDNAQIDVNGATATAADLAIGQLVTVQGRLRRTGTDGIADSVVFEANVRGPIDLIDLTRDSLVVIGQPVVTDASTRFELDGDPPALDSLGAGEFVEISGYIGAGGVIVASRIERVAGGSIRVRGRVANVDTAALTLTINGLVVDYGSASLVEGFSGGQPADGDEVIAVGQALGVGGELIVNELRLHERLGDAAPGEEAEVEDLITRFISQDDFDVGGVPVTTSTATDYEGGDAGDLAPNVKVQVEGTIGPSGVIVAEKVEIKDGGRVYDGG